MDVEGLRAVATLLVDRCGIMISFYFDVGYSTFQVYSTTFKAVPTFAPGNAEAGMK